MSPLARVAAACLLSLSAAIQAGESTVAIDFPGSNTTTLTLGEAIQMALKNNLEVEFDKELEPFVD